MPHIGDNGLRMCEPSGLVVPPHELTDEWQMCDCPRCLWLMIRHMSRDVADMVDHITSMARVAVGAVEPSGERKRR